MRSFAKSAVYQIYTKSFMDSNGDGIGDISGVVGKLDYLKELGIDYIWMTPFFCSPLNDNGYDISDYYNIDPVFGTMEELEELIKEADKRGIGLMFDMVFNHTSTHHEWFKKALSGDEKYMNYYIFKDPVDGHEPTNWVSKFGGNAWEYVPSLGKYYLHLFDVSQADLNWENPQVREEMKNILRFWKKKGIKGFRFDVINLISKPDVYENDYEGDGRRFYTDGPRIHQYIRELVEDSGIDGMVTVGEMSSTSIDNCIGYSNPDNHELAMVFNFHHLKVDYKNGDKWELAKPDIVKLKKLFNDWQTGMQEGGGWNANFWCNHDQPRAVSRFGDDKNYRERSAKMLATATHMLRGTPYVYQGEEIGMTNTDFTSIDQYKDVESLNYYNIMLENGKSPEEALHIINERSRDNGRTPMQWDTSENAGFSKGEPWIGVNGNYKEINAQEQVSRTDSVFAYYKKLIELRKKYDVIADGDFSMLEDTPEEIFAYERILGDEKLLVLVNFSGREEKLYKDIDVSGYELLISNTDTPAVIRLNSLKPYEALVYYKRDRI
jgi:trehalose-6-phosphate hydrolase